MIFLENGQVRYQMRNTVGQIFTGSLGDYAEG